MRKLQYLSTSMDSGWTQMITFMAYHLFGRLSRCEMGKVDDAFTFVHSSKHPRLSRSLHSWPQRWTSTAHLRTEMVKRQTRNEMRTCMCFPAWPALTISISFVVTMKLNLHTEIRKFPHRQDDHRRSHRVCHKYDQYGSREAHHLRVHEVEYKTSGTKHIAFCITERLPWDLQFRHQMLCANSQY
jgi:hypothetical protein